MLTNNEVEFGNTLPCCILTNEQIGSPLVHHPCNQSVYLIVKKYIIYVCVEYLLKDRKTKRDK